MPLAPTSPAYCYRGAVVRIVDGDTCVVCVDLGFRISRTVHLRLSGYDAPELFRGDDAEREQGAVWKQRLAGLLPVGETVLIRTEQDHTSFDRYVAAVWRERDGLAMATAMMEG